MSQTPTTMKTSCLRDTSFKKGLVSPPLISQFVSSIPFRRGGEEETQGDEARRLTTLNNVN